MFSMVWNSLLGSFGFVFNVFNGLEFVTMGGRGTPLKCGMVLFSAVLGLDWELLSEY